MFSRRAAVPASFIHVFPVFFLPAFLAAPAAVGQNVVIDRTTPTTITGNPNGSVTVDIAPANGQGVSLNRYEEFSVGLPGVKLNNQAVSASTIVNEVTSTKITTIEGPLEVLGPSADVVIANPNGIVVDGGRFIGTGNVALTTGKISLDVGGYAVATIDKGAITIGAGGLTGVFEELDLISRTMRIEGAIQREDLDHEKSSVNLFAGQYEATFGAYPFGGIGHWASVRSTGSSDVDTLSVDITRPASLRSGSVRIAVNNGGAGVRLAGDTQAGFGGFRLSSSGNVEIVGGVVEADQEVDIKAASVTVGGSDRIGRLATKDSGVVLQATEGDIELGDSELEGNIIVSSNLGSSGGVTLISEGDIKHETGDLSITSKTDSIAILAGQDIKFTKAKLDSADNVLLTAGRNVSLRNVEANSIEDSRILSNGTTEIVDSKLVSGSDFRIDASGIDLRSTGDGSVDYQTELTATNGGIVLRSTSGNIANRGSFVQGARASAGDPDSHGAITILSAADLVNESYHADQLGVFFGEFGDLNIATGGSVNNRTGRLFSNANIRVAAAHDFVNELNLLNGGGPLSIRDETGSRHASTLWLKRRKSKIVSANYGDNAVEGELGLVIAIGDVDISATNIVNNGGDIGGTNVNLIGTDAVRNSAGYVGEFYFEQKCLIFCSSSGHSNLQIIGGGISANEDIYVEATNLISNAGGRIVSGVDTTFVAPEVIIYELPIPILIERPSGLTGFFRGHRSWVSQTTTGGHVTSVAGILTIDGDLTLGGVDLLSADEIIVTGVQANASPEFENFPVGHGRIGALWDIF